MNNLKNILQPRAPITLEECSGVYRIQCSECDKFYIGQTERKFIEKFKEHLPKKNPQTTSSNYALHLINENHNYTGIKENMEPVSYTHLNKQMNEKL